MASSALLIKLAVTGLVLLVAVALLLPTWLPHDSQSLDWLNVATPPSIETGHWLGTDRLGRDLLARVLQALQVSLLIGVLASAVSMVFGTAWGMIAGYLGGRIDELMMRFVDILYSLPYVFIVIILTTVFARGSWYVLFIAIGAVGWLNIARIVRGQTLALKEREFVLAARALGVNKRGILLRHILPNLLGTIVCYAALSVPQMILYESFLSFLGLGVQEPMASLGNLIYQGAREMDVAVWMLLVPAGFLLYLLLFLNLLSDALRDRLAIAAR